jgi:hypothetical protein
MWDPSPDASAIGYVVYIRVPGGQPNAIDVGNTTSYGWNGAVDGQQYYVSVAAYAQGGVIGAPSTEVPRYTNRAPSLANPGLQFATRGSSVSLQLSASDPDGSSLTYGASGLPPGLSINSAGRIAGVPTATGSFVVVASVTDGSLSDAETFTWTVVAPPQDSAPAVSVALPNSGTVVNPGNGSSSPNTDTAVNTPASPTTPAPTQPNAGPTISAPQPTAPQPTPEAPAAPAAAPAPPQQQNARSMARSVFGKKSDAAAAPVATASGSGAAPASNPRGWKGVADAARAARSANATATTTTAPQGSASNASPSTPVTVQGARTTPWSRAKIPTTTTDKPVITLAGSAADDRSVGSVEWITDRGLTGLATGTETWIAAVPLLPGLNKITINVRDNAGNVSSTTVAVDYVDGQTRKK